MVKVREMIELLSQCDPDAVVATITFTQGTKEINIIERYAALGGVGTRYSFEEIPAVVLWSGHFEHMKSQGCDVLGYDEEEEDDNG